MEIAVGHSNGYIALYKILPQKECITPSSAAPIPYLTIPPLYPSPLLVLASAWPTHPMFLASSSLSGYTRLLDLRRPNSDTVHAARSRCPSHNISYSPHLFSMITSDESVQVLRVCGLRCWTSTFKIGRTSLESDPKQSEIGRYGGGVGVMLPGTLDCGKVHTSVAWGTPDGRVLVTNPVAKMLSGRKSEVWQQVVCAHEWVPTGVRTVENDAVTDGRSGAKGWKRLGVSRVTEGYKPQRVMFGDKAEHNHTMIMFEEEAAVTAVSWNPNSNCGGWLAMSWASGLLRVIDVAL